ncbi:MAG TPA: lysophospholipid acyltransferase family protein [Hyphomicrobiaceae bacterium]|nr:lysophospholipid acyltransferase family protein [Hyphomicrobiaceae bacterium]
MPSLGDLRHRVEYLATCVMRALIRALPFDLAVGCSAFILRLAGPLSRRHRRALANLAVAFPEKSEAERRRIAIAMWENMGRVLAETMRMDQIAQEPHRFQVIGGDRLGTDAGSIGPLVMVTLHMGNWELAVWPFTVSGGNPAGVYRPLPNPYVDRLLYQQRSLLFRGGLFGKGKTDATGHRTARLITDFVRKGGWLGFVCDQVDRRGLPVPFFGGYAKVTPAPAMIARHVGAELWLVRCLRGVASSFSVEIRELKVPRTADRAADVQTAMAAIFKQFEDWIRERPEQWMWWNTRWVEGPVPGPRGGLSWQQDQRIGVEAAK